MVVTKEGLVHVVLPTAVKRTTQSVPTGVDVTPVAFPTVATHGALPIASA
jgi:hypothetical protein